MGEFQQQRAADQLGNIQSTLVNIRVALEAQVKALNIQNGILVEFLKEYKLQGFERRPKSTPKKAAAPVSKRKCATCNPNTYVMP